MTSDSQATQILPRDLRVSFSSGDVLRGRYRLDSQIGRGGMGVVYRATDLELHRRVHLALELLHQRVDAEREDQRTVTGQHAGTAAGTAHDQEVGVRSTRAAA